jgi:hypothetical protein
MYISTYLCTGERRVATLKDGIHAVLPPYRPY